MELFECVVDSTRNLLPRDGIAHYYGRIMAREEADRHLDYLLKQIEWKNDEAVIMGKKIITRRQVAWYAEKPFEYTYSKVTKRALTWTPELLTLKNRAEEKSGETFNSCLLNLYHDGSQSMAWHSDGEKDLKKNGAIGSLSFGAERRFCFKHKKTKETVPLTLEHGSLLIMKDVTQSHWLHCLPPTKKVTQPRVNLTFRTIQT